MTLKQFEKFIIENAKIGLNDHGYNVIGLCGEAGEVAEHVKKAVYRKDPKYTNDMLRSELGDVLHYLARIALANGITLNDVMEDNVKKIEGRRLRKEKVFAQRDIEHICLEGIGLLCEACEYEKGYMR